MLVFGMLVDKLSKMTHFAPTIDEVSAEGIARLILHHVVRLHGVPREFVTDRDKRFDANFMRALCSLMGVQQSMSSAYHPQSDGQTERMNRVLEDMLRHYVKPTQVDWDEHLDMAEFAVNNSYQESIKMAPFKLVYGSCRLTPVTMDVAKRGNKPAADKLVTDLQSLLGEAKQSLSAAQSRQREQANKHRRDVDFNEQQEVLLSSKNIKLKGVGTPILMPRWLGLSRFSRR